MKKYMIDCDMSIKIYLAARKLSPKNFTVGCPPIDAFNKALEMFHVSAQCIKPSNDGFEVDMEEHDFQILAEKCELILEKKGEYYIAFIEKRMDIPALYSANACQAFKPLTSHSMAISSTAAVAILSNTPNLATQVSTAKTAPIPPKSRI